METGAGAEYEDIEVESQGPIGWLRLNPRTIRANQR